MLYGADAEALDAAARSLSTAADELDASAHSLSSSLDGLQWLGSVAVRFSDSWNSAHSPRMVKSSAFLREASTRLHTQAQEQRAASAAGSGGTGSVSAPVRPTRPLPTPFAGGMDNQYPENPQSRVVAFGQFFDRQEALPQNQFEILRVSDNPPRYIINLPGVEFNLADPWEQDHLRDLRGASVARLTGMDAYAERVKLEMQRAGVPAGAEVMLVGHSAGAIAAMNIARDHSFNQPGNSSADGGYHVQVTHVMAAGAGLLDWVDDPPAGTNVMMVINRNDVVAAGIQAGDFDVPAGNRNPAGEIVNDVFDITDPRTQTVGDGRVVMEFSSNAGAVGHHYNNYEHGLATADQPTNQWMDDAAHKYFTGGGKMQAVSVALPDHVNYGTVK